MGEHSDYERTMLPIEDTKDQPDAPVPNTMERGRRDRKPPKYWTDFHIGHFTGPQSLSCSPNTGKNSSNSTKSTTHNLTFNKKPCQNLDIPIPGV